MLKIEKFVLPSPEQWEIVMEGMRNPKNSWDRMDSYITHIEDDETLETANFEFFMGDNDYDLAKRLRNGGSVHAKYRRMIPVWVTITAPLYWWKEFDTYKVGTVANSCSTMHKIAAKEFTLEDFSCEHLMGKAQVYNGYVPTSVLECIVGALNEFRKLYLETKDKSYWWQMIQLLPSSYNQKRTVMLNYEVLANIYESRKDHKLDEWHTFCHWIDELPYSELITGYEEEDLGIINNDDIQKICPVTKAPCSECMPGGPCAVEEESH